MNFSMILRRWTVAVTCLASVALSYGCGAPADTEEGTASERSDASNEVAPKNVLIVTSDTTRRDYLGCYGGPARTPALDQLAEEAVRFHDAHSVAFGTTPSHASLFTSRHPLRHGSYDNKTTFSGQATTLAEILRSRGFRTAAFLSAVPVRSELGFSRGFETYEDEFQGFQRRGDETVGLFLRWLEQPRGTPFFVWIHLFDPHQPYDPPPGYLDSYLEEPPNPTVEVDFTKNIKVFPFLRQPPDVLREVDRQARARYLAEIEFLDAQVGRVIEGLQANGSYDDTLLVYTADHGENFIDPYPVAAFNHGGLHPNVTNIPLLIRFPGAEMAATESRFLLGNLDVAPTILDYLDVPVPEDWSGQSFLDALRAGATSFREHLVLEGAHRQEVAVRSPTWLYTELTEPFRGKSSPGYLAYPRNEYARVFDLREDTGATNNLVTATRDEVRPAIWESRRLLEEFRASDPRVQGEELADPEHLEGLRALGYID